MCRFNDEYTLLLKSPDRRAKYLSLPNVMSLNKLYKQKRNSQFFKNILYNVNLGEKYNVTLKDIVKIMFNLINGLKKIISLLFNRDRLSENIEINIDINYNIY